MKFKSTLRKVSYAPSDLPTGAPATPSGELTPEQAQEYLEKSEQTPSQTISPEEAQKALEESQKQAEANKEETLEEKVARLEKELEAKKEPKKEEEPKVDPLKDVTDKAEKSGIKVTDLEQEYITNGKLSEESMKSLKEAGFSEEAVKAYIAVKEEQAFRRDDEILKAVGISTREEYVNMATWLYQNMDEKTIAKYDSAMGTPQADVVIEKYYKLYKEATGGSTTIEQTVQSPVSLRSTTQVVESNSFKSEAEMVKAIQDPRYERDYDYRNAVIKKIMNSPYKK